MNVPPKPGEILETAVYAADLDAAEGFYAGTLGMEKIARVADRHVFFRCGRSVLLVFNPEATRRPSRNPDLPVPVHGADGQGHVCFSATSSELDSLRKWFESRRIPVEADFSWPGGSRSIYVRDPAGNSVEFAERSLWFDDD